MVAKKRTTKRSTKTTTSSAKRVIRGKKNAEPMRSFRPYRGEPAFTTFKVTRQTVYWTILLIFIIVMQLWILKVQLDIAVLTDQLLAQ